MADQLLSPYWAVMHRRPADYDFFKAINDNHGHAMGDRVLQAVSHLLTEVCRGGDITARWGGEEFIILLPETTAAQATQLAERLRMKISALRLGLTLWPAGPAPAGAADR